MEIIGHCRTYTYIGYSKVDINRLAYYCEPWGGEKLNLHTVRSEFGSFLTRIDGVQCTYREMIFVSAGTGTRPSSRRIMHWDGQL